MSWSPSSRREAWRRLCAARPPDWVLGHSLMVEGLALAFCAAARTAGVDVDEDLVDQGALLHDIGRSIAQDVRHASVGADLLRAAGVAEPVVRIVERHTGAGIPPDEARSLGLPPRVFVPETIEERIVAHADNLYSGSRRLALDDVLAKYRAKGLDAAASRVEALHHDLELRFGSLLSLLTPLDMPPLPAPPAGA